MSQPYPIIEQRSLEPSQKRGLLGLGKRFRESDELPKPNAHHNLVYRVDGQYVLDNAELLRDAPQVTNATHVSLVDMTRDAAVMVQFDIPSADASVFTIQVTFICTVKNPITVVREGLLRADERLRAYLKSDHKLFGLGLDYSVSQINGVRRIVNDRVKAFTTIQPLVIPGISTEIASVEVLTPDELVTFEKNRRDVRQDHELAAERQSYDQVRENDRKRHEQQRITDTHDHERSRKAKERAFERAELIEQMKAVDANPSAVLHLANVAGEVGFEDLSSKLMAEEQRKQDIEREDILRKQKWEREDKELERDRKLATIRILADSKVLDFADPYVNQILTDLCATPPKSAVESKPTPELTRSTDSERDVAVREEDEN